MGVGSKDGWVEDGKSVKKLKKDGVLTEDYHGNIDATAFEGWLLKWLRTLPEGSVLIFDNASYHR